MGLPHSWQMTNEEYMEYHESREDLYGEYEPEPEEPDEDAGNCEVEQMKPEPIPNLQFEEETHTYTVNGIVVPSVSEILQPLSMQGYRHIDKDVLKAAADRGTSLHFSVELYDDTGYEEVREDCRGYFEQYKAWKEKYKPEIIATEYRFYHPTLWYAGTVDKVAKIGNEIILIDLKTTAAINHWYLGPQLGAYAFGLASQGVQIDKRMVLHLTPEKYTLEAVADRLDVFMQCLKINQYLKESGVTV